MSARFPPLVDRDAFYRVIRDDSALRAGLSAICEEVGVRGTPERFEGGSRPVYAVGRELVLKLYSPFDADEAERETAWLRVLHGRLPVPTPELHATGKLEGWSFVLMQRLPGELLTSAWSRLSNGDRRELATQLGDALRALHAIRDPLLPRGHESWRGFIEQRREATVAQQRERGLGAPWLEQIPAFLEHNVPALLDAPCDAPIHTEVMREHLLVDRRGGSLVLSGTFDFEPAMIGAPEYDFASVGIFFSCGDSALLRDVLAAYGYSGARRDVALTMRLFAYALLHRYSSLAWYLERIPPPPAATRLEDLARHFFAVA